MIIWDSEFSFMIILDSRSLLQKNHKLVALLQKRPVIQFDDHLR